MAKITIVVKMDSSGLIWRVRQWYKWLEVVVMYQADKDMMTRPQRIPFSQS